MHHHVRPVVGNGLALLASLGGSRPKASLVDPRGDLFLAKFGSADDEWPVVTCDTSTVSTFAFTPAVTPLRLVPSSTVDRLDSSATRSAGTTPTVPIVKSSVSYT